MAVVLSIDAGTTGVRTIAFDEHGTVQASAYREFPQHFPEPGRVEHDPEEIWSATLATLGDVVDRLRASHVVVAGIGITNQRETTVVWDRAIVWQDRRTAVRCDELRDAGVEGLVRARTGLVLDPYFSATKLEWLLGPGGVDAHPELAFGTVDSWILWRLTGGADGGIHATDPSNASRTMLFDIRAGIWCDELLERFGLAPTLLPQVLPSSGRFGTTRSDCAAGLEVPVAGIAGDQQAALFGQACFEAGMTKNTYGTGSFVLMNVGDTCPEPVPGLLTTVAWSIGDTCTYALEGSIFVTGAAIQWLRDGLGIIADASETEALAASVPDAGGIVFVPALTGLGSPYWDPYARGTVLGITRGTGRAHLVRAVVDAMVWQTCDVVRAMTDASGHSVTELRVDGGASVMNLLCRLQADALGVPVRRPAVQETTALGAAYLAGIAEGVWSSPADAAAAWASEASFEPTADDTVSTRYSEWTRAVERSRSWAAD